MGAGYYDRTFAFIRQRLNDTRPATGRPALIGLAHECQKQDKLELADWDIPLAGVATDQALYWEK